MTETEMQNSAKLQENIQSVPGTKTTGHNDPLREDLIPEVPQPSTGEPAGIEHPGDRTGDEAAASLGDKAEEQSLTKDSEDVPQDGGHSA